ncbi:MAG: hypothetical protein DSZ05_08355 [Sulfurospirillum sp.]|nr:MAG: hypothetical protein DSZ05_08355 [Sulfurospirillum sp.]
MNKKYNLIFGCDEYALQIARNLIESGEKVHLFTLFEEKIETLHEMIPQMEVSLFDLSDEWGEIERYDPENMLVYCALSDEAKNVFLTISLRTAYENIAIIALASDREHATKLKMAGANKMIVTAQITANILHELISNPTVSQLMQKILYENSDLKIAQITVSDRSELIGMQLHETEPIQARYHIILLAVIDAELQTWFAFNQKGLQHQISEEEILIVVGRESDIEAFREKTGDHYILDWRRWHWKDEDE